MPIKYLVAILNAIHTTFVLHRLQVNKGDAFETIKSIFLLSLLMLFVIDIAYATTERALFGQTFVHVGDYISNAFFGTFFICSMVKIIKIKLSDNARLSA